MDRGRQEYLAEFYHLLRKVGHRIKQEIAREVQEISFAELAILRYVLEHGPVSVGSLAQGFSVSKSFVTATAEGLVRRGYVEKEVDPGDRRIVRLRVTPDGERFYREIERRIAARFAEILEKLGEDLLESCVRSLRILDEALGPGTSDAERGV
ncbi:MarR family winged helix-turn-helix transcriptional regulator [Brockia lithotrophica]|uniref:MarR family winged helix-turn-helix transcriptional regulator n=1 Tax=Brockia lithotrophica TaxID=933949 RepID=UPI001473FD35|nr:MarR family transcriptional regulator [Brockia lithotrophica]